MHKSLIITNPNIIWEKNNIISFFTKNVKKTNFHKFQFSVDIAKISASQIRAPSQNVFPSQEMVCRQSESPPPPLFILK